MIPTESCGSMAATRRLPVSRIACRWRGAMYPARPVRAKFFICSTQVRFLRALIDERASPIALPGSSEPTVAGVRAQAKAPREDFFSLDAHETRPAHRRDCHGLRWLRDQADPLLARPVGPPFNGIISEVTLDASEHDPSRGAVQTP